MATERVKYLAHSANDDSRGVPEPLEEHLRRVRDRAAEYASPFSADVEAGVAGVLHDIGKYSERFLKRLRGVEHGLDHWTPGAILARKRYGFRGTAVAAAVLGHHIGLQHVGPALKEELQQCDRNPSPNLTEASGQVLLRRLADDGLTLPGSLPLSTYDRKEPPVAAMLDVRMLFSALVDADFIETEAHFNGNREQPRLYRPEGPSLDPERALRVVRDRVAELSADPSVVEPVGRIRRDLFESCLAAAAASPGLFTLSAPTGAGKTLGMLAFALEHARRHPEMKRVVVVIPYLSIIEQAARVYRRMFEPHFGPVYVLEDDSLADARFSERQDKDDQDDAARAAALLAENWDAPLTVTTSVQCLESLFANRAAACRKLHRMARSVILFDEVQTLPPRLALCTLAALSRLTARYGSTVVFSTATQPAFDHLHQHVRRYCTSGWQPREIVPATLELFSRARRTKTEWRIGDGESVSWDDLTSELTLAENRQVLCVVNLKRHARALAEKLRGEVECLLHLSTNMCPLHRQRVLRQARRRLASQQPCVLVSTQCVEAGVDIDFPRVYRAFAPLDSIAQAAGRCNREGRLGHGVVRVFLPQEAEYPPGWYKEAADATRLFLNSLTTDNQPLDTLHVIEDPARLSTYYRTLYDLTNIRAMEDRAGLELRDAFERRDFVDVAERYRLIAQGTISVLVPYRPAAFARLRRRVEQQGRVTREWVRDARAHAVALFRPRLDDRTGAWNCLKPLPVARNRTPDQFSADWFVLVGPDLDALYDRDLLGLNELAGHWVA